VPGKNAGHVESIQAVAMKKAKSQGIKMFMTSFLIILIMSLFIWGCTLQWKSISEDVDKDNKISKAKVGGYGALTFIVGFLLGGSY